MNLKKFLAISIIITIACLSVAGSSCAPEAEKVFKFAHLDGFTGESASWAWMSQASMEIAVEDIEASGGLVVGGERYKIEIVKYDHQWDAAIAFTLAKKMIYEDGIKYAHVDTDEQALAINDLTNNEKVILMPIVGSLDLIDAEHPFTWNHYPLASDTQELMFQYCAEAHPEYRRIAAMYLDSASGYLDEESLKMTTAKFGWEIVDIGWVPHGATDFHGILIPLLEKNPDVIEFGLTPPGQQGLIIGQARELGYKGIFMHSDTCEAEEILSPMVGWEALEGCINSPKLLDFPTEIGKSWKERFVARYGYLEAWPAWEYDFFWLMKLAIEKADSFDTEKVNAVMAEVSFDGIFGNTYYKSQEERFLVTKMGVCEIINGEWQQVYVEYPARMKP